MAKCILRTAKINTKGGIGASLDHNYRERETRNANPNKAHENSHDISTKDEAYRAIENRIPEDRRKNAVICVEYMITASPEFFKDNTREVQDQYFDDAKQWLVDRHGEENVITTSIHRDETSPHLIAYVVPMAWNEKQQKQTLNAREYLGGRQKLSAMQTDFAKSVGHHYALERGVERSGATHTTVKEFYANIQKPLAVKKDIEKAITMPKTSFFESKEAYGNRVANSVLNHTIRSVEHDVLKANYTDYSKLETELEKTKNTVSEQAKHIQHMHTMVTDYSKLDEKKKREIDTAIKVMKIQQDAERKYFREREEKSKEQERQEQKTTHKGWSR